MFCITLDVNGKEVFREEKPKRYRPKNGFEKRADGNFYKHLGDPRCISDLEKKERLLEEERRKKEDSEPKGTRLPAPRPLPSPREFKGTILLQTPSKKIDIQELIPKIKWTGRIYPTTGELVFLDAKIHTVLRVMEIDTQGAFKAIKIFPDTNTISFWLTHRDGSPDYILCNALEES